MAHNTRPTLVIGTHNRKKGAELADLLAPRGFSVVTLDDMPDAIEVVEDGDSFAANARLKASQQAVHLGRWVLLAALDLPSKHVFCALFAECLTTLGECDNNTAGIGAGIYSGHTASCPELTGRIPQGEDGNGSREG